jgi:hypothetical protein
MSPESSVYTEEDLKKIGHAVGLSVVRICDQLARLDNAALQYRFDIRAGQKTPRYESRNKLRRVHKHVEKLIQLLEDPEVGETLSAFETDNSRHLSPYIFTLTELADLLKNVAENLPKSTEMQLSRSLALDNWLLEMAQIYADLAGKKPGFSRRSSTSAKNAGQVSGPFFRFLEAASAPLGIKQTPEGWISQWRRMSRAQK